MDLIGRMISNYQIVAEIGRGGMGTVYRAVQPSLNRSVAIKILSPALEQDQDFLKRFKQEALAMAALEHPNIVRVYDSGEDQGCHYIAMEYVGGANLFARMKNGGPIPVAEATAIAAQIACALDFAHRRGIVHRDVKPSNILLDTEGRAVLTDLGIAHALEATRLTRTGLTMGTPEYMSPEQAEGKPIDGRADLYSLGIVLYEMLMGRVPFTGDTPFVMLYKHIHESPSDAHKVNPAVPKKLAGVLRKALEKDPAKRFATGQQMAAALTSAVPTARIQVAMPALPTVAWPSHTPEEIASMALAATGQIGTRTLRAVGSFALRLLLQLVEALLIAGIALTALAAILIVVFSFVGARYAQTSLSNGYYRFDLIMATQPYQVTAKDFAVYTAPSIQQSTFGMVQDASLSFAPPDRMLLTAKVIGNPVVLESTVFAKNGVPQIQLQHLNGLPLPVIDGIISNGINQGWQEGWANAPIRIKQVTISGDALNIEAENK